MKSHSLHTVIGWMEHLISDAFERACNTNQLVWTGNSMTVPAVDMIETFSRQTTGGWLFMPHHSNATLGLGSAYQWQWGERMSWHFASEKWHSLADVTTLPRHIKFVIGQAFSDSSHSQSYPIWDNFSPMHAMVPAIQIEQPEDQPTIARLTLVARILPTDTADTLIDKYHRLLTSIVPVNSLSHLPNTRGQTFSTQSIPDQKEWRSMVTQALEDINHGDYEKIVVARSLDIKASRSWDVSPILKHLRMANPDATVFAWQQQNTTFLGASPEQLVAVQGRQLQTICLAGSSNRGLTPEEDSRLAEELRAHPKHRHEHHLVCRHIQDALAPLCRDLHIPVEPTVQKLPSVQHLSTPVEGTLLPNASIWTAAAALQPTPAVAGLPVEQAAHWIAQHEPFSRGWYAGTIGQVDLAGNGSFVVSLRSAVLSGNRAVAYAGCGIVTGSNPDQEFEESRWKLRPILEALGADGAEW